MIEIDMDMPKSCYTCLLSYLVHNIEGDVIMCPLLGRGVCKTKRHKRCPLKECKNEQRTNAKPV